jgi:ABC-type multidrug transport system ATPase subunit
VTFDVPRGCVLGLLGPNGAGKSTLFGCLLGTVQASRGRVLLNGSEIADEHRRRFGYVAERVALYPHRTVTDNAEFFARLRGQDRAKVGPQLERVGLRDFRDRKVRTLSKGLLQRLGLAIALVGEPELLILDEPFNGLDPALLDQLHEILGEEQQRGATLLISTHTMSAIEPLASHIAIMLDGKLAAFGTLDELRSAHCEQSLERIYHRIARRRAWDNSDAVPPRRRFEKNQPDCSHSERNGSTHELQREPVSER